MTSQFKSSSVFRALILCVSLALTFLQAGCGSRPSAITPADKAAYCKRPLIISLIGDDMTFVRSGLTNFELKVRKVPVPDWRLNDMVSDMTANHLRQGGVVPRVADSSLREIARSKTWSKMIGSVSDINFTSFIQKNAALFGDADSIILIEGHPGRAKEYGGGATAPALGYFSIGNQVVFCGTVRVFTYAAPTGRHLSWAHGYDSGTTQGTIPFRSWAEASPAEQSEIREKVSSTMQNSLREALWRTGF